MTPIRLAIAGVGAIGQAHLAVVQKSPFVTLSALVDPSPEAAQIAHKAGVPLYNTLDNLLAQDRPDGVVLATPNPLHVPQALQCVDLGLPILLEKPLATSVAEGEKLVRAAEQQGAKILVGHHRAHSPLMAKACEVVRSGQLGQLVSVVGSALFFKPDRYFDDHPWRKEKGAGPLLVNLIHEIHNLRMLCGEITAVQAFSSNAIRGFAVEDTVSIALRFANGALGTFMLSDTAACARSWEQTSQENPAYTSYSDEDCYVISGTQGSLSVPTMRLKTYPRREDRSWWNAFSETVVEVVRDDPLQHQMAHFAAVVRGETQPLVSARDGLQNLRVTEAIAQAAASGSTVHL